MRKVLFVDDDFAYITFFKEILEILHLEVVTALNATDGIEAFKKQSFDLVISDLQMAKIDGFSFLTLLKKIDPKVKLIFLTGSDSDEDEVKGLELNAVDYIKKTTTLKVLLKRIEKAIYQESAFQTTQLESSREELKVDLSSRKVYKAGQEVRLAAKEFDLLVFFLKNKNTILERERIIREVWDIYADLADTRVIDSHVKKIRSKLDLLSIFSIRGVGYEWVE